MTGTIDSIDNGADLIASAVAVVDNYSEMRGRLGAIADNKAWKEFQSDCWLHGTEAMVLRRRIVAVSEIVENDETKASAFLQNLGEVMAPLVEGLLAMAAAPDRSDLRELPLVDADNTREFSDRLRATAVAG